MTAFSRSRAPLVVCGLALVAVWCQADEPPKADPVALVRARVMSVEETAKKSTLVTLEVVHVYSGPADLKGRTFLDSRSTTGGSGGLQPGALFAVNEEGLWTVRMMKTELRRTVDKRFPFSTRSRKADNPRHAEAVKLAEAVEAVEAAKADDRPGKLKELFADPIPEVGAWAAGRLGESESVIAREFFAAFAAKPDGKLPLATQIAVDEALAKREKEAWLNSKPRAALLRTWVEGKADAYHAAQILRRLNMGEQVGEFRNNMAVELLAAAAGNSEWRWEDRRQAINLVGVVGGRAVAHEEAYTWLFAQAKGNADVAVRRVAAGAMAHLPLYPKRAEAVEKLLAAEQDKQVADGLRAALQRQKEHDK